MNFHFGGMPVISNNVLSHCQARLMPAWTLAGPLGSLVPVPPGSSPAGCFAHIIPPDTGFAHKSCQPWASQGCGLKRIKVVILLSAASREGRRQELGEASGPPSLG